MIDQKLFTLKLFCLSFLLLGTGIMTQAQVKIPKKQAQDSLLKNSPPNQVDVDKLLDSMRNAEPEIPPSLLTKPTLKKRIDRAVKAVKYQLPKLTEVDTKLKLRLRFPWRDDILIPLPKALKTADGRPPYDPDVAYQRSLIIPGWGQAYNRSYWKMPIFYAGYGGFIWWINFNNQQYQRHGIAYRCSLGLIEGCVLDPEFAAFDPTGIRTRRDNFRRDRDFAVIIMLGWHLLHVIEAYVDAHLKGFDVSEDLTLNFEPTLIQPVSTQLPTSFGLNPGLQVSFSF
jgi:hypothetical protein